MLSRHACNIPQCDLIRVTRSSSPEAGVCKPVDTGEPGNATSIHLATIAIAFITVEFGFLVRPLGCAPFDLWWDRVDENLLPLNPDWWVHRRDPNHPVIPNSNSGGCDTFRESKYEHLILGKDPKCTTWDPDVDEANLKSFFCHAERPFSDS